MDPIVTPDWLRDHLGDVVVCHVGSTMVDPDPEAAHRARHLPGARFTSLEDDLSGEPGPVVGRHPLPDPDEASATLARLGLAADDVVIAYDERGGAFAARLVWMLRILGRDAALLDGGLDAWGGPIETGPVPVRPVGATPVAWPDGAVATSDDVAAHLAAGGVVIDSREPERYRGEVEPIDAVAGHVPGAIDVHFAGNLRDGRFLPAADLARRFDAAVDDGSPIVYCGSGVTACHNALAMEAAGRGRPRVYVASWSGWSTEPGRDVAVG